VIAQLSISMVLVVGATLFIGTLLQLYRTDRGLHTEGVLTFGVRSSQRYAADRSLAVQTALVERLDALPGVMSASATQVLAIGGGLWTRGVKVDGYTFRPDEDEDVGFNVIAPKYFSTIGTPVVLGREFDSRDSDPAKRVTVVNESFARYFFGGQSPLGRHVTSVNVVYEIVGVVKDAKYESLKAPVRKTIYIPWMQRPGEQPGSYTYLARVAGGNPLRLTPSLERLVREADPALRLRTPRTYDEVVDQSIVSARIMAALGGFFGLLALVVACLGIFGLMAFQVSRRINEVGVRMALGARRLDIQALVLRDVVIMLIFGSAIGSAAALALSVLAGKMLFGMTPAEPGVFAFSGLVLGAAALSAGWLPALRASRIDPMAALRHE
jgi:predicted permease